MMKIWAHRGCSQVCPENTLCAFEKAASIKGLTGIELDIQMTRDGHIVVFHDERVERVTNGIGELRYFTLAELKKLTIDGGSGRKEQIPEIEDVLSLLEDKLRGGLKLNIELKNSIVSYEGMEKKIIDLIHVRNLQDYILYSSFSAMSIERLKRLDPKAETGILDKKVSDCLYKLKGGCRADAVHPCWQYIDLPKEQLDGYVVRAWFTGHLYPEKPTGAKLDLGKLEQQGITDVFLNEPEQYL